MRPRSISSRKRAGGSRGKIEPRKNPMNETIALTREVEAIQVPSGDRVTLPAGTSVIITQALGGAYTVHAADQARALPHPGAGCRCARARKRRNITVVDGPFEEEKVWEQLRNCYDPEIPLNIVDLGLIYSLSAADERGRRQTRECENDAHRARLRDGSFPCGRCRAAHPHACRASRARGSNSSGIRRGRRIASRRWDAKSSAWFEMTMVWR